MIKVSYLPSNSITGPAGIPLFGPADGYFEKVAAPLLLPEVVAYIEKLTPRADTQYVLGNAMGASEYYGSNSNGDAFPEEALIHRPDDWSGNPALDAIKAKTWSWGFPTFYNAKLFAHHRNKDASKGLGEVELAAWNPHMKRVELVIRADKDKCLAHNGSMVWDKLKNGDFFDLSMGSRVPNDLCSECTDWPAYYDALATFDPKKHKNPGEAANAVHRAKKAKDGIGIRGLSITRKEYCQHTSTMMNRILPSGQKIFVYNFYPNFFDISAVFIGADKIAKLMMKIADSSGRIWSLPGAELAEKLGYDESAIKCASEQRKEGEIVKNVSGQFAQQAIPELTKSEKDVPKELLDVLGSRPLAESLSTTAGMGVVLRPREFQRIMLIQLGLGNQADRLDNEGTVFPKSDESFPIDMGEDAFNPALAKLLLPMLAARSGFGPFVERRVLIIASPKEEKQVKHSSLSSNLLHKIGSAYNSYRASLMNLLPSAQAAVGTVPGSDEFAKLATIAVDQLITPMSYQYFKYAFLDEMSTRTVDAYLAGGLRQRGEGLAP